MTGKNLPALINAMVIFTFKDSFQLITSCRQLLLVSRLRTCKRSTSCETPKYIWDTLFIVKPVVPLMSQCYVCINHLVLCWCFSGRVVIDSAQPLYVEYGANLTLMCTSDKGRKLGWTEKIQDTRWQTKQINPVLGGRYITRCVYLYSYVYTCTSHTQSHTNTYSYLYICVCV